MRSAFSRFARLATRIALIALLLGLTPAVRATPVAFDLPAQPAAEALLAFSRQAGIEVLFSFDQLRDVSSAAVAGPLEPEVALVRLLGPTGFTSHRNSKGKFVVTLARRPLGSLRGKVLLTDGSPAIAARVALLEAGFSTRTDRQGEFEFKGVPAGTYRMTTLAEGYHRWQWDDLVVTASEALTLAPVTLRKIEDLTQLDPIVVDGRSAPPRPFARARDALPPRNSIGNIDLPRTENDALPFAIYDRDQIMRSGVVGLSEFVKRTVLESGPGTNSEDVANQSAIPNGSELRLRGFNSDETVVLLNGRRVPEVLTAENRQLGVDVNYIPLSLIQQIEVLPVSASALYSGNAVGGVINIVLRPELDATEVNVTYTDAVGGFNAPQSSVSLLHGQSLLNGRLHVRVNASFTRSTPPSEAELGYRRARPAPVAELTDAIFRATPNVRSVDGSALSALDFSPVTSVAPGAGGTEGLAAFANRSGVRNLELFDGAGGLTASIDSLDYAFGRKQRRNAYFGSVVYEVFPWLQLGLDGAQIESVVNRGYDLLRGDLTLAANSPLNPFGQDIAIALNETTPKLGSAYSEARLKLSSLVVGALVKMPRGWQASLDTQYVQNLNQYRGLGLPDLTRWQRLVDRGDYQPLRDTRQSGPPDAFYNEVLVYYGGRDRFVKLADFQTLDAALRVTNRELHLPTGLTAMNIGGDYRRTQLEPYADIRRFGDGSLAAPVVQWTGRTLQRYSAFAELQTPLVPERWLSLGVKKIETDFAARYVAADSAAESNLSPTFALKAELAGGFSLRGSVTVSSRFPTPQMSQRINTPTGSGGTGSDVITEISDPRRGGERYAVTTQEIITTGLSAEESVTQSAGAVWQRGKVHRVRAAVDFVDTNKVNELVAVTNATDVVGLESFFPNRVVRAPLAANDPWPAGRVTTLYTGILNLSSRTSQNWSTAVDYVWTGCAGGTLEAYGRWLYFQRYDRELVQGGEVRDELRAPDGTASNLLKQRVNFGVSWSRPKFGFGLDSHYYSAKVLPVDQQLNQGARTIKPYWQFDAFVQGDLTRFLPWRAEHFGLRAQLRVNNISGFDFPKYVDEGSGSGVQPYGDWRGRTYSVSVTASF